MLRDLLYAGGVTRVPGLKALERSRHDGLRASGENDSAAGAKDPLPLSGSHSDAPFTVEASPSANDVEAGTLGPAHLTSVVVAGNPLVTTLEQVVRSRRTPPRTLLAAMAVPTPVPQMRSPRSTRPSATARATWKETSG